jgi:Cu(I)/Ag(I) efflux system membrane fusion protein
VPKSAVLWTGKKAVVYIKQDLGETFAFHYREIILGEDTGSHYVVAEGLDEGEEVVTNGAFKIDAAAQLKGSQSMMNPDSGKQSLGGHEAMDMGGSDDKDEVKLAAVFDINDNFKSQFSDVVLSYLNLKDEFVATDAMKATEAAGDVKIAMGKVEMELLKGEAHMIWMTMMTNINRAVEKIINNSDIEAQRLAFSDLSDEMYNTVKRFDISGLNIYYQFCPMAKNDKGAYWLSSSAEIRNPYFGDVMLKCGEIKETLN